jgi:hypothetical protein
MAVLDVEPRVVQMCEKELQRATCETNGRGGDATGKTSCEECVTASLGATERVSSKKGATKDDRLNRGELSLSIAQLFS